MNNMTDEIDAVRAELTRVRAENERLQGQLQQCRNRSLELVELWREYSALERLQFELTQRPLRRTRGNGRSSQPVAEN
jgi:hypothetical protein